MLALLESDPRGRTWLSSFDFGLLKRHCPKAYEFDVLERAYREYENSRSVGGHPPDVDLAWSALKAVIDNTPVRAPHGKTPGVAARRRALKRTPSFTHVTTVEAMEKYHFDGVAKAVSGTLAWNIHTDNSERFKILKDLLEPMFRQGKLTLKSGVRLGSVRCWVSGTPLGHIPVPDGSLASHHRDVRGLSHFTTTSFLVAYCLDARHLSAPSRPAAIDGVGLRFRAWCDKPQRRDHWGTAVDLGKFARSEASINGVTEALIPASPIPAEAFLDVRMLGHPGADDGVTERGVEVDRDDHATFDARIQKEASGLKVGYRKLLRRVRRGK